METRRSGDQGIKTSRQRDRETRRAGNNCDRQQSETKRSKRSSRSMPGRASKFKVQKFNVRAERELSRFGNSQNFENELKKKPLTVRLRSTGGFQPEFQSARPRRRI